MDKKTLDQYESKAKDFIGRYQEAKPQRMYELMGAFFHRKGKTLDVGCASGRDLAYLKGAGFDVEGVDAVESFVKHCKEVLSNTPIYFDTLPQLESLSSNKYDNILISAVLMHLPDEEIPESIQNLLRITKDKGRLLLSIRTSRGHEKEREEDGRLFTNIPTEKLLTLFRNYGGKVIFQEEQADPLREGVTWRNFVVEKARPVERNTQKIRPLALGIITNEKGQLLLHKAWDSVKNLSFYRPLGGGIEFGETGAQCLEREFQEEIQKKIIIERELGSLENIFTYEGRPGHEIVLLYKCRFENEIDIQEEYDINESGEIVAKAVWANPEEIEREGAKLFPDQLVNYLKS